MIRKNANRKFVVDSWAWIEYMDGTNAGKQVAEIIENEDNHILASAISVAEIVSKYLRNKKDPKNVLNAIEALSMVIPLDNEIAQSSGQIHAKMREKIKNFGLGDAIILATANRNEAKLVTGDFHFKSLPNIFFVNN